MGDQDVGTFFQVLGFELPRMPVELDRDYLWRFAAGACLFALIFCVYVLKAVAI